jgi:beta-lactamase regulating signal transducer with metallopeptidase domain
MRRALAAFFLSVLLLFTGVDSSAIGAPSETVPAVIGAGHSAAARSVTQAVARVTIVARAAMVWLLGLVALLLCRLDAVVERDRSTLRWMARARRGPPALAY